MCNGIVGKALTAAAAAPAYCLCTLEYLSLGCQASQSRVSVRLCARTLIWGSERYDWFMRWLVRPARSAPASWYQLANNDSVSAGLVSFYCCERAIKRFSSRRGTNRVYTWEKVNASSFIHTIMSESDKIYLICWESVLCCRSISSTIDL